MDVHGVVIQQNTLEKRELSSANVSDFTFTFHFHALEKEMATHSSVLAFCLAAAAAVIYVKCLLLVVAENGSFSYFCPF